MAGKAAAPLWDVERDGNDQLGELYSMERNQDLILWTSSSVFVVANAVLATGFFGQEDHYLARMLISLIGLMVTLAWFVILQRAHAYEVRWIEKAKGLQTKLNMPPEFCAWEDLPPAGFSATKALIVLVFGFSVFWIVGVVFGALYWIS
jgi:hypothetical protein